MNLMSNGNVNKLNSRFNFHICTVVFFMVLLTIKHSDSKNCLYFVCYIFINKETALFASSTVTDAFSPSFKDFRVHAPIT